MTIEIKNCVRIVSAALLWFSFGMLMMYSGPSQAQSTQTTVYLDSTRQVIRGFGAANIVGWRPDMASDEIGKAFSTDDGRLGFSILRLRIPPSKDQWSNYVPTAKAAHEMGVKIVASPWSPPAEMKTNNSTVGGRLRDSKYDDYAAHLDSFNTYMEEQGVPLYAISVQNEPDVDVDYESCDWTAAEMSRFMEENASAIGTRVIAPESFNFNKSMSDPILNDSAAASELDIVGGHIYGGGLEPYPLAKEKGKELWMTEHLDTDISWQANLATGKEIHDVMADGMNAYIWWYIVRFYGPIHDGIDWDEDDIDDNTAKGEITKRGYIMSQFSRFIRPGFMRLKAPRELQRDLYMTAYKSDDNIVLVVVNMGSSEVEQTIGLQGGTTPKFAKYVTSKKLNAEQQSDVQVSGNQFTATFGAESVTTLVANEIVTSIDRNGSAIPGSYSLEPNFPNPFNPSTTISYSLPKSGHVTLTVSDMLGRTVAELVDGQVSAGSHTVRFDASNLASGVYLYRLKAGDYIQTRQMTLIK